MRVAAVPDVALGNTSYLVDLGAGLAAVVDPRRDVDVYLALGDELGLRIVASLETHLHADFVSGSRELAEATGAEIVGSVEADLAFGHRAVGEADELRWRDATVRPLPTPGHTPEHLAYVLLHGDEPVGVFSGGSLIVGGAARTDLVSEDVTEELARAQFRSLRRLARLPDAAELWPTHGGGSFCSTATAVSGVTTVGEQRRVNPLLQIDDEGAFVKRLRAGFGSFPPYFLRLRDVNRAGPPLLADLDEPGALDPLEVHRLVEEGAWLLDARDIHEWAQAHPRSAVSIALRPAFASWVGWVVPFGSPVVLLVDEHRLDEALRLARRIGYDRVVGWLEGGVDAWRRAGLPIDSVEEVDAPEAARRAERGDTLLDVRQAAELARLRVQGARHLELGAVIAGAAPGADGGGVIAFCGHGERSATAASLLERRGLRVANLVGGTEAWEEAGLPVER